MLAIGHSSSAAARIEQLFGDAAQIEQPPGGRRGAAAAVRVVLGSRLRTLYLADIGMSTTVAAALGRLMRKQVIVDTGDAVFALARSVGGHSPWSLALVGVGEQVALRSASHIVVRGRAHGARVPRPATHIPDLPPDGARPAASDALREELRLDDAFVVGLVGTLNFSPRLQTTYGWDLIEALASTKPEVAALIVGDGSGLGWLQNRAHELGVFDRCRFVGRVAFEDVSRYINVMDLAISTQTNDLVGRVRTTGKLPAYLACGCPVLATNVGEAARLLGPLGWTLPYDGVVDRAYPARLAAAIEQWRKDPGGAPMRRRTAVDLAAAAFDVETMRERAAHLIADLEGGP